MTTRVTFKFCVREGRFSKLRQRLQLSPRRSQVGVALYFQTSTVEPRCGATHRWNSVTQYCISIYRHYGRALTNCSEKTMKLYRGLIVYIHGGSNMTGTDLCLNKPHKSRSYLNHLAHSNLLTFEVYCFSEILRIEASNKIFKGNLWSFQLHTNTDSN